MSGPDMGVKGKDPDEGFLGFVTHALKVFGPTCSLSMQIGAHEILLTFPPDPSWAAPKPTHVQTSARPTVRRNFT